MNKSTKILAGLSTALILGGAGTATYFGVTKNNLQKDHDKYVQEATLRDEEAKKKQEELENKILIEGSKIAPIKAELERLKTENANLTAEIERLNSVNESLNAENENLKILIKDASTYTTLEFTYNEVEKTASVRGNDDSIASVEIPAKVKYNNDIYSVTEVGGFSRYMNLKSVTLPEGITTICSYAFDMTTQIESINIPASVTTIGEGAFARSTETITVDAKNETFYAYESGLYTKADNVLIWGCNNTIIKEGTTAIGAKAFYYCSSLTSITLPEGLTTIGESAFYGCSGLTSLTIPASVTEIGESGLCDLTNVIFEDPNGWKVINMVGEETNLEASALSEENISQTLEQYKFCSWAKTEA